MKASGLVLWGSLSALALAASGGGCGGKAVGTVPNAEGDGGASSGSSSGVSGSSSGVSGSSSGFSGSSSGFSGSSSGMDGSSSGSGSGSSSGVSGSSSGTSGSSSGVSGSSSGTSGSSSGGSSGGANGSIYVEECTAPFCSGQSFSVYGSFYATSQGNGGCTLATSSGACAYYTCSTTTQPNGVSAGTITVAGPWLTTPLALSPTSGTNAYQYSSSSPGFTAGQNITVTASGATVPAFGPDSVIAPELTQITNLPTAPDGGTTVISTGADLPLTWTGGQAGATMLLEVVGGTNGQNYTYCSWSGSDGQGTVAAVTLKPFSGSSGYLIYGQYNSTSFNAGSYAISLSALPYTGSAVSFQ